MLFSGVLAPVRVAPDVARKEQGEPTFCWGAQRWAVVSCRLSVSWGMVTNIYGDFLWSGTRFAIVPVEIGKPGAEKAR